MARFDHSSSTYGASLSIGLAALGVCGALVACGASDDSVASANRTSGRDDMAAVEPDADEDENGRADSGSGGADSSTAAAGAPTLDEAGSAGDEPSTGGGAGGAPSGGSIAGSGGSGGAAIDPDALRIANVSCEHERAGQTSLTEGQYVSCSFDVLGKSASKFVLSCEDTHGKPIECGSSSRRFNIGPDGALDLPYERASFGGSTDSLGGTTQSIVLVATAGAEVARKRLDFKIDADDGVPVRSLLSVDCGQAPGVTVIEVQADKNLDCLAKVLDPDPELLEYKIDLVSVDAPTFFPTPYSGGLWGTGFFGWTFFPQASDVGKSFEYRFWINDYVSAPVEQKLTIVVK